MFSITPSLLKVEVANLIATLSPTGTLKTMLVLSEPKFPAVTSTFPSNSPVGLAVTKFINPWTAFLPDSVPWGPFNTSILSRSWKPESFNADEPTAWPFIAVINDGTTAAPTPYEPTPLIEYDDPVLSALSTIKPGTISAKSLKSSTKFLSISSAVNASIETGISWTDFSCFVAVTTTSSTSWANAENEKEKVIKNVKNE